MNEQQRRDAITDPDPAIAAIEETTALVVLEAEGFGTIREAHTYEAAGAFLTGSIKPARKEIAATFGPIITAAHATHKEAVAQRRRHEEPLIKAEQIVKAAMGSYVTEQRRITAEAEAERMKAARDKAEAATLAEASRLEEAGHTEAAEEMITAPVVPIVSTPPPAAPKAAGVSTRMVTKYRIINESAIDRAYLMPDEKKIRQVVRAMGGDAARLIGGIEVYEEPVIAASAR